MVLAIFDMRGMIYCRYSPIGTSIKAAYIVDVMAMIMKIMRKGWNCL